jgi:hypothetical protein
MYTVCVMSRVSAIDRHRTARARPLHPLDHRHRLVAVDVATELLGNFVDDLHRVVAGGGHEVRRTELRVVRVGVSLQERRILGESWAAE